MSVQEIFAVEHLLTAGDGARQLRWLMAQLMSSVEMSVSWTFDDERMKLRERVCCVEQRHTLGVLLL